MLYTGSLYECVHFTYIWKALGWKQDGSLNPIESCKVPFITVNKEHLGPLPSTRKEEYGFSQVVFLKVKKTIDIETMIVYMRDVFCVYAALKIIISDRSTAFTAHKFGHICKQNSVKNIKRFLKRLQ